MPSVDDMTTTTPFHGSTADATASDDLIAVTGLGVYCATGRNVPEFLRALRDARVSFRPIHEFDVEGCRTELAAVCDDIPNPPTRSGARANALLRHAVDEALRDAGLLEAIAAGRIDARRVGVVVGTSLGGMGAYVDHLMAGYDTGSDGRVCASALNPHVRLTPAETVLSIPANVLAHEIAQAHGFSGGTGACVTACSAGANALAIGADMIRLGRADVVIAAGVDALTPLTFTGFHSLKALPRGVPTPFDRDRGGLLVGEGAAALVLARAPSGAPSDASAQASVYAEFAGYGLSNDAYHATQPHPEGRGAVLAMWQALADAGLEPEDVGYVNMHGTGTRHNDPMELEAMRHVFGARAASVPISSIKGAIGHTLGAAGAIEAVASVLALHHGFLPANGDVNAPIDGFDYDVVQTPRPADGLTTAMSNSFAFGGNCASLVFRRSSHPPLPYRPLPA
jgi:3-oxoacyl-[acyl-carrier-protein] synthase II